MLASLGCRAVIVRGTPKPPASSAADRPRLRSSSARGLPCVSSASRSAIRSSSGPVTADRNRAQASARARPPTSSVGNPCMPAAEAGGGEHQPDRLVRHAPGDEAEHVGGSAVQPVRVVDQAQQRPLGRGLYEQPERRQRDEELGGRRAAAHPEGRGERVTARFRQTVEAVEQRAAELMQARERQIHLLLHADGAHDTAVGLPPGKTFQQRGLAGAAVTAQHERASVAAADVGDQAIQCPALTLASAQHRIHLPRGNGRD